MRLQGGEAPETRSLGAVEQEKGKGRVDQHIVLTLNQWVASQPAAVYLAVLVAESGIVLLPLLLGVLWLWPGSDRTERRSVLLACVISFALALLAVVVLEHGHAIERPRPFVALPIALLVPHAADSSFPSDHTLLGVALIGPLLWRRPHLGVWPLLWALLIGLARVAVGIHYPSDIVGSAVIAVLPTAAGLLLAPVLARLPFLQPLISSDRMWSHR